MNANDIGATVKVIRETKTRWNESTACVGTRGVLRGVEDGWATVKFFEWYSIVEVPIKDLAIETPTSSLIPLPSSFPLPEAA